MQARAHVQVSAVQSISSLIVGQYSGRGLQDPPHRQAGSDSQVVKSSFSQSDTRPPHDPRKVHPLAIGHSVLLRPAHGVETPLHAKEEPPVPAPDEPPVPGAPPAWVLPPVAPLPVALPPEPLSPPVALLVPVALPTAALPPAPGPSAPLSEVPHAQITHAATTKKFLIRKIFQAYAKRTVECEQIRD